MHWFEQAPLWIIWPTLSLGLIAAMVAGYLCGKLARRGRGESDSSDSQGFLMSAALALLGLLIAFTFSMASSRLDARRGAPLQAEALESLGGVVAGQRLDDLDRDGAR